VATVAIKGISSSSKSFFPKLNQGKRTCLMAKESKRKIKTKGLPSPKYVSSDDDDASFPNGINEKAITKKLEKELVAQYQLLEDQENLLEQERKNTCERKRLWKFEEKNEELTQGKESISSLKSLSGALQNSYGVFKRLIKILKCNLMLFGQALQSLQAHPKLQKPPLALGVKDAIILILMLFVLKASIPMLSKLL
jgi:hypothetical protein